MTKIAIVYWSGTGNTELMAQSIKKGLEKKAVGADLFSVETFNIESFEEYTAFAFGCPSMGNEILEESEFEPFFTSIEEKLKDKKVILFGSYGWGDGEWMRNWEARVKAIGAQLIEEGLIVNNTPDDEALEKCETLGAAFAVAVK